MSPFVKGFIFNLPSLFCSFLIIRFINELLHSSIITTVPQPWRSVHQAPRIHSALSWTTQVVGRRGLRYGFFPHLLCSFSRPTTEETIS